MSQHVPTIDELFEDGRAIDEALLEAARDAAAAQGVRPPDGHLEGRPGRVGPARGHSDR